MVFNIVEIYGVTNYQSVSNFALRVFVIFGYLWNYVPDRHVTIGYFYNKDINGNDAISYSFVVMSVGMFLSSRSYFYE